MKYLTLILLMTSGEIGRNAMPAHDCYAADCHHGAHAVLMSMEDDHA